MHITLSSNANRGCFVDCGDDVDANYKENIDSATSYNDSSVQKDAL